MTPPRPASPWGGPGITQAPRREDNDDEHNGKHHDTRSDVPRPIERYLDECEAVDVEADTWTRLESGKWANAYTRFDDGEYDVNLALIYAPQDGDSVLLDLEMIREDEAEREWCEMRLSVELAKWLRDELTRLLPSPQPT